MKEASVWIIEATEAFCKVLEKGRRVREVVCLILRNKGIVEIMFKLGIGC